MRRVNSILTRRGPLDNTAAVGIGSLIIFIAMILVAGIAASVIIETMNVLEQQALTTGKESMKDISSGLKITQVSGYYNGTTLTQLAIFTETIAGSDSVDLEEAYLSLSDSAKQVILNYSDSVFSTSVSGGLFGTLDDTQLSSTTFGIMVVRDIDSSCLSTGPNINEDDLVILLINATDCFSGISTRTRVTGNLIPEQGISGVISFTTPSAYIDTIIELQT